MKLFVNENDTVSGSLYIGSKDDKIICFDNELAAKGISGLGEIVKHDFVFRKINFGISKKIQEKSFISREGLMSFDPISFRYERVINTLKSWTIKEENGDYVQINKENLDNLDASLASAITSLCDKLL